MVLEGLKEIPALTRVLGRCGGYFEPLPEEEVRLLQKIKKQWNWSSWGVKTVAHPGIEMVG